MISLPLLRPSSIASSVQAQQVLPYAHRRRPPRRVVALALTVGLTLLVANAWAEATSTNILTPALSRRIVEVTQAAMADAGDARVEIVPGALDPNLRLAPCQQIEPHLPPGTVPWGRMRVGLRCVSGPVTWNVYVPVAVKVWRKAVVSTAVLPAGTALTAADLQIAEVDVAGSSTPVFTDPARLLGRRLVNTVGAGVAMRVENLRTRQWFAAGDKVTLVYRGEGFEASTEGQALNAGLDGQPVRVRVGSGQVLTGMPAGDYRVEVRS